MTTNTYNRQIRSIYTARTGGSRGGTTHVQGQCLREGEDDAVRQRCDDEAPVEPHVLVAVAKGPRALPDDQTVHRLVPAKAQHAFPLKLAGVENAIPHKALDHVAGMDVNLKGTPRCEGAAG